MSIFTKIKEWFLNLFKPFLTEKSTGNIVDTPTNPTNESLQTFEQAESQKIFKITNVILEKLNFLEQYIKIFANSFPNEYANYLDIITKKRLEYELELKNYQKGFAGNVVFAIDPEQESRRALEVSNLEKEIKTFVDNIVKYTSQKERFTLLCHKLNKFYNALINHHVDDMQVIRQFKNAASSANKLLNEVLEYTFSKEDSRKKEEFLNYAVYCDYILLKVALRYDICSTSEDYKRDFSNFSNFFAKEDYDKLIYKFFIGDLGEIETFVLKHLTQTQSYNYTLECCQKLQSELRDFSSTIASYTHFNEIIKLENTLEQVARTIRIDYIVTVPSFFGEYESETTSVNDIAISVLKVIPSELAKLLGELIASFPIAISWKEFYFLSRIFNLYQDIVVTAKDTIFSAVHDNFLVLNETYPQYTNEYIKQQSMKLVNYKGSKKKKYVLLFPSSLANKHLAIRNLQALCLDFVVINDCIYLNHSYFNGFTNLESIFKKITTF